MKKKGFFSVLMTIFALVFLIGFTPAQAEVASKGKVVTDDAGYFTSSQVSDLEKALSGQKIGFYLVSSTTIGGQSLENYGHSIFVSKKLGTNDVLFFMYKDKASGKNQFFVDTQQNAPIDNAVSRLNPSMTKRDNYTKLINDNFVPYAKQKDVVGGILKLEQAFLNLNLQASAPVSTVQSTNPVVQPTVTSNATSSDSNAGTILLYVFLGIVVLAGGAVLISVAYSRKSKADEANVLFGKLRKTYENLSAGNLIEFENTVNREFDADAKGKDTLLTGEARDLFDELQKGLSSLFTLAGKANDQIKSISEKGITFSNYSSVMKLIPEIERDFKAAETSFEACSKKLDLFKNMKKKFENARTKARENVIKAESTLAKISSKHGVELSALAGTVADAKAVIEKAASQGVIDPAKATKELELISKSIQKDVETAESLLSVLEQHKLLPQKIENARQSVKELAEKNGIWEKHFQHPMSLLSSAESHCAEIAKRISEGDAVRASSTLSAAEELIENSLKPLVSLVQLIRKTEAEVNAIESELASLSVPSDREFESELSNLKSDFHSYYWNGLSEKFEAAKVKLSNVKDSLPKVKELNSHSVQEFIEASEKIKKLRETFSGAKDELSSCFAYKDLSANVGTQSSQFSSNRNKFEKALNDLEKNSISLTSALKSKKARVSENAGALEDELVKPYDLRTIDLRNREYADAVKSFSQMVETMVSDKQKAETRLKKLQNNYSQKSRKYSSSIKTKHSPKYNSHMRNVEVYIENGNYAEAMASIALAESVLSSMDHDYSRSNSGGSSSWGSSYGSSSSYGGGGSSSWDSGSSSSDSGGTSSWDSGGSSSWDSGSSSSGGDYGGGGSSDW